MAHSHLTPQLMERLMRDELSAGELKDVLWHLLDACPVCAQVAEERWALLGDPGGERRMRREASAVNGASGLNDGAGEAGYPVELVEDEASFDRVRRRVHQTLHRLSHEREEAQGLLAELVSLPTERLNLQLRNNARYRSLPLCELLIERTWELSMEHPKEAEALAATVLEIIDRVESPVFGNELRHDLIARAWAYRGNAQRILTDLREADASFSQAEQHLSLGTGDLLEKARVLGLKASLRRYQRRYEEANELLQRVVAVYLGTDEDHLAGRAMIVQAQVANEMGNPAKSISLLKQSLNLVDGHREPRLLLCAQQNLVADLADMGLYQEAMSQLPKTRRLSIEHGTRFDLLRFRWLEGLILQGLGHDSRAEAAFLEVRKGFIEEDMGYDAALVSLNLAALYARQGRTTEIKRLAAEMLPIFESRQVHREAVTALLLFRKAVEMETVTVRMVEEVAGYLRRSQDDPRIGVEQPS